jgi:hypothetical protein
MAAKQTKESFWGKVNIISETDCWEWKGSVNNTGYGTVAWNGKVYTAHRVAAYLSDMVDSIAAPKHAAIKGFVLHKCDNRKCCNPNHFFIGTYADNQLDAYAKKRRRQPKGSQHVNAKLTNEQVMEIRTRYKNGELQVSLAKEFLVSQRCISLIVRGETYKWI